MAPAWRSARPRHLVAAVAICTVVLAVGLAITRTSGPVDGPSNTSGSRSEAQKPVPDACRELIESPPAAESAADDLVLGSANVLTMDGRRRAGEVTVHRGRIAGVGAGRTVGSRVIDLDGATVLPGLIDSHSHWIGDKDLTGDTATSAIDAALAQGWTSISEMFVDERRLNELCALETAGDLRVKVGAFLPINYEFQRFGRPYRAFEPGQVLGPRLFLQGVKIFADRADDGLGYQTDTPGPGIQGKLFWKRDKLAAEIEQAHEAGWQIAIHATGDGGLDAVLDAIEPLRRSEITRARHRIEHLTVVRDDQVDRIASLGLIASVQHSWFHADSESNLTRWLGPDRLSLTGRWRDLVEAGILLAGGTDHPWAVSGESGDSTDAIAQAVTRVGPSGKQPSAWMRAQHLTVWEVLRSLTIDAAFAQGTEDRVGSIEVGKAGDLVVLSADPTRVRPEQLARIEVLATIVDGRVEFCSSSAPRDLRPLCPA